MSEAAIPEYVHEANAEKARAEAEQARAAVRKTEVEILAAEYEAAASQIEMERILHKRAREKAGDEYARVYRFVGAVDSTSVKNCMAELELWSRLEPGCDITVVFNSPGGGVVEGMALWDFLQEIRERGHELTTVARGYAASMAGILLQAGDVRVIGRESWLLIHEASFGVIGSYGEVEDRVEWVKRLQERILDIFAARSKMSKTQIRRRWRRRDWWISSDDALKWGFCDRIG